MAMSSVLEIPTTELARHLGDYLARVRYGHDTIVVLKNNDRVAEIRPLQSGEYSLAALLDSWKKLPPDPGFADDVEAVSRADMPPANPWD
jgi:prevent-host-death family protein